VLGDDVMIVTAEYDRWSSTQGVRARDRLDVLGLEASGRLVVVEIKRVVIQPARGGAGFKPEAVEVVWRT